MLKKYYKYDKNTLDYKEVNFATGFSLIISSLILLFVMGTFYGKFKKIDNLTEYEKEMLVINVQANNDFSQTALVDLLKKLNVKFPHIVLAQAKIETGNFKSKIFRENHNLFGMKQAVSRSSTAEGTQYNHAYYDNWQWSVMDYALYQSAYLRNVRSEAEYYAMLNASYAEASNYVEVLKSTIEKENLKSLF